MKTLAIIGSNGMLGSDLVRCFSTTFNVIPIDKKDYRHYVGSSFDIIINANGNSKRFWANQKPLDDFFASTVSVYQSMFDFSCDLYIYISSSDVYENHKNIMYTREENVINPQNLSSYGFNKYLAESIIKKFKQKFIILRSSMILGKNLKKGPFYDIANNIPLYITFNTKLQLITTSTIADIILVILKKSIVNETFNVGGVGTFSFANIRKYFTNKIEIAPEAETQLYQMNVKKIKKLYPSLKTSEEYLKEFLGYG